MVEIPTGRLRRATAPALLATKAAVVHGGGWLAARARRREQTDADIARFVKTAEDAAALMGEMKGAVMKLGQLLSFADLSAVPEEFRAVLAQLQSDAPPMAWDLVEAMVVAELGDHPDALFERFSRTAMAAASIGQVHSARLHDGTDVVVKVQYPGVADAIEADLKNTALVSTLATAAKAVAGPLMPKADIKAFVAEIRDRVSEELDYVGEAENQELFREIWAGDPYVRIPAVIRDRSSARVLTQEYDDGMRWAAAIEHPQELRDQWGQTIYRFVFTSLYRHGVFNADPHPGNYLFGEDGSVTFLDFGCIRRFTPDQVAEIRAFSAAVTRQDAAHLNRTLVDIGLIESGDSIDADLYLDFVTHEWAPVVGPQPFTYTKEWAQEALRRTTGMAPEYLSLVKRIDLPAHWLFLGRISLGVTSVLTGLEATGRWRDILEEIWA